MGAESVHMRASDRVVHVGAGVVRDRDVRGLDQPDLALVEVNPVREERSPIEDACVREPRCDA